MATPRFRILFRRQSTQGSIHTLLKKDNLQSWYEVYFSPVEKDMQHRILFCITGSGSSGSNCDNEERHGEISDRRAHESYSKCLRRLRRHLQDLLSRSRSVEYWLAP
ncbi:hypothetical protein BofuT4_P017910.1 [Botrytis cinerea T4]|uniref:Uncharacterized protein n=1 Tax=Botryotinia fuckeliana (strain T4) TaxID=999810 RepID=G2YIE8_BOTF4|nr:hypothetical protein BofuT4_P017910.1 [Botrytis cinerea T4]